MLLKYIAALCGLCMLLVLLPAAASVVHSWIETIAMWSYMTTNEVYVNGCIILVAGFLYAGFCRLLTWKFVNR